MLFFFYAICSILIVWGKTPRIVGGDRVTDTTSFPWIVSLITRNHTAEAIGVDNTTNYLDRHVCGGSIIDASWILTAAHCFDYVEYADEVAIVAGTYNLSSSMGQLRNVDTIWMHGEYSADHNENDIALLELEQPLVLSDSVAIILPANLDDPFEDGQVYTVAGWGAIDMNATVYTADLYAVEVPGVDFDDCNELFNGNLFDTNLCAGDVIGKDSCTGDSGGPMTMAVDSLEILYGIVSWGPDATCAIGIPAVYTDVAMYRAWIEDVSGLELGNAESTSNRYQLYMVIGIVLGVVYLIILIAVIWWRCSKSSGKGESTGETRQL